MEADLGDPRGATSFTIDHHRQTVFVLCAASLYEGSKSDLAARGIGNMMRHEDLRRFASRGERELSYTLRL